MSYRISFVLPGLPKTVNAIGRKHWAAKVREARMWKRLVWLVARPTRPKAPLSKAKLTLTRVSSVCPDSDGLVSSFKHVIDGLIEAGIIENDKYENVGMPSFVWEKGEPGKGFVRILVEGVQDV